MLNLENFQSILDEMIIELGSIVGLDNFGTSIATAEFKDELGCMCCVEGWNSFEFDKASKRADCYNDVLLVEIVC